MLALPWLREWSEKEGLLFLKWLNGLVAVAVGAHLVFQQPKRGAAHDAARSAPSAAPNGAAALAQSSTAAEAPAPPPPTKHDASEGEPERQSEAEMPERQSRAE